MFEAGTFVAERIEPVDSEQVQPTGVDLTLDAVFEQREPGRISREGVEIGDRRAVESDALHGAFDRGGEGAPDAGSETTDRETAGESTETYYLPPGGYVVRYGERIAVPENHVGFVYPRSSLLRNSCTLDTAVWDAGYEGRGEGLLQVHRDVELERGARIAQFVLAEADHDDTYDGAYQGENVE